MVDAPIHPGSVEALIRLIEADAEVLVGREVRAKQEVLSFQHQQAIQQTNFAQQYNAKEQERPLGDLPLLASRLKVEKKDQKKYQVSIHDDSGQGIQLSLNQKLIHSICKLLADTSDKADWKLNLKLAGSTPSKDQRDQSSSIVH